MKLFPKFIFILVSIISFAGCKQEVSIKTSGLTEINPLSYTDVIFISSSDTVLTSTFDGKIRKHIKGRDGSEVIIDLSDEIYSLAYDPINRVIFASTLSSGVVVIDAERSEVVRNLPIKKWAKKLVYNPESNYLLASDAMGQSHCWNTSKGYSKRELPDQLSEMSAKTVSEDLVIFDGPSIARKWNIRTNEVSQPISISGRIADADKDGNILSIDYNEFALYNSEIDSVIFKKKHPDWPIHVASQDTIFRAPVSMYLSEAKMNNEFIFTSSVDRSIRSWNKKSGEWKDDFLGHRATISAMDISPNQNQLVSVDLKGGLRFWELNL